jgi:hypothetical protein
LSQYSATWRGYSGSSSVRLGIDLSVPQSSGSVNRDDYRWSPGLRGHRLVGRSPGRGGCRHLRRREGHLPPELGAHPGREVSEHPGRRCPEAAKKIYKRDDCENDRQRKYWDEVKLPFIYGICRLYDGAGHEEAKRIAAIIRDHAANNEPIVCRYSVEGATLNKEDNRLLESVVRRVAVTVKALQPHRSLGV